MGRGQEEKDVESAFLGWTQHWHDECAGLKRGAAHRSGNVERVKNCGEQCREQEAGKPGASDGAALIGSRRKANPKTSHNSSQTTCLVNWQEVSRPHVLRGQIKEQSGLKGQFGSSLVTGWDSEVSQRKPQIPKDADNARRSPSRGLRPPQRASSDKCVRCHAKLLNPGLPMGCNEAPPRWEVGEARRHGLEKKWLWFSFLSYLRWLHSHEIAAWSQDSFGCFLVGICK